VLDYQPLGVVDTPAGARQHVVVVAAQRDMIDRLLAAVRGAGLAPVGIDLSAFAMIRSLYRSDPDHAGRVLYINVDGLTNVAIAEGTVCRFTRVVGGGIEELAGELAVRRGIPVADARVLLTAVDLRAVAARPHETAPPDAPTAVQPAAEVNGNGLDEAGDSQLHASSEHASLHEPGAAAAPAASASVPQPGPPAPALAPEPSEQAALAWDVEAQAVLENGIRTIAGEVRNSLDFHRSQGGGGDVSRVVLSGSVLDLPGFAEALQLALGLEVHSETISTLEPSVASSAPMHRLAVAAGLAAVEVPQ